MFNVPAGSPQGHANRVNKQQQRNNENGYTMMDYSENNLPTRHHQVTLVGEERDLEEGKMMGRMM